MSAESTTTVVIGSGLSGLAVASELSRNSVPTIVVPGIGELLGECSSHRPCTDPATSTERADLLRLLRTHASNRGLDIRQQARAGNLRRITDDGGNASRWMVHTDSGLLLANNVVLTNCPDNQIRRLLNTVGIAADHDFASAMHGIGMYLVGIGNLLAPTTREIIRQAKQVSDTIVSQLPATAPAAS